MKNNNLDEMQEQKLLKIEHNGFWIAFWGLAAAVVLQALVGGYPDHIMGEVAVLLIISLYMLFGCLKNGIWDRRLKPNLKTNLLLSLAAGLFIGIFFWLRLGKWLVNPLHLLTASAIAGIFTFFLTLGALTLCSAIYKKRRSRLDAE